MQLRGRCAGGLRAGGARLPSSRAGRRAVQPQATPKQSNGDVRAARMARILRQYEAADVDKQQDELQAYIGERDERRGDPEEEGSTRVLRASAGYRATDERDQARVEIYLPLQADGTRLHNAGLHGKGQECWWAIRIKPGREKQVVEAIERMPGILEPLAPSSEGGQPRPRTLQTWAPKKSQKVWSPKTGKMGNKVLKYPSRYPEMLMSSTNGGMVFVKAEMDKALFDRLAMNPSFISWDLVETFTTWDATGMPTGWLFPKPATPQQLAEAKEWEADLEPVEEAVVRAALNLPAPRPAAPSWEEAEEAPRGRDGSRFEGRGRDRQEGRGRSDRFERGEGRGRSEGDGERRGRWYDSAAEPAEGGDWRNSTRERQGTGLYSAAEGGQRGGERQERRDQDGGGWEDRRRGRESGAWEDRRGSREGGAWEDRRGSREGGGWEGRRGSREGGAWEERPQRERREGSTWEERPQRERREGGGWEGRPQRERREGGTWEERPQRERREGSTWEERPQRERREGGAWEERPRRERREDGGRQQGRWEDRPPARRGRDGWHDPAAQPARGASWYDGGASSASSSSEDEAAGTAGGWFDASSRSGASAGEDQGAFSGWFDSAAAAFDFEGGSGAAPGGSAESEPAGSSNSGWSWEAAMQPQQPGAADGTPPAPAAPAADAAGMWDAPAAGLDPWGGAADVAAFGVPLQQGERQGQRDRRAPREDSGRGGRRDRDGGSRFGDRDGGSRFGDRDGGSRFGDREQRGGRFGDREQRGGRFGDREQRGGRFGDREQRGDRFGERSERRGGREGSWEGRRDRSETGDSPAPARSVDLSWWDGDGQQDGDQFAGVFSPESDWQAPSQDSQEERSSGRGRGRSDSGSGRSAGSEDSWYAGSFDAEEGGSGSSGSGSGGGGASSAFQPGQEIAVVGGSFADFGGKVVAAEGGRVTAELDIFGKKTRVELSPTDVAPSSGGSSGDAVGGSEE